jgi:hypothetical protein
MKHILAMAVVMLVAACGDDDDPSILYGEWELRAVAGNPLPAVIDESEPCTAIVQTGRVNMGGPPQSVLLSFSGIPNRCVGTPGSSSFTPQFELREGDVLLFLTPGAAPDTGVFNATMDTLSIRARFYGGPKQPFVYVRTR